MVVVRKIPLTLQIGHSPPLTPPPQEYEIFISPIPENILSTDILKGQTLQKRFG